MTEPEKSFGRRCAAALLRVTARLLVATLGVAALLFPHPGRFTSECRTLANPQRMVDAADPAVAALSAEIDREMPANLARGRQILWIEEFIGNRITYVNDWDQWANVDYWPPPGETLARGKEDCDGIAIVTASVLRRRGFDARIEASIEHVWVAVGSARILSPDKETNFDGESWSLPGATMLLSGARYGLREFPLWRWAVLAAWVVLVVRWPRFKLAGRNALIVFVALAAAAAAARWGSDTIFAVTLAGGAAAAVLGFACRGTCAKPTA